MIFGNIKELTFSGWALSIYHGRENGFIIDVIVAGDLSRIVAVHFNNLREIVVDGVKGQVMILTPGDSFFQGFPGSAGPEDELVTGGTHLLKVFN